MLFKSQLFVINSPGSVTDTSSLQSYIDAIEQADSPERLIGAVQALVAIRLDAGIPALISVLGYNNPGAAMIAVKGLVQFGETAVLPLLNQLDDYNYGARAYAVRALATIADPRALDVLLTAAETDFAPSVRRAATKGLGMLRWFQLPPEQVPTAQVRALNCLLLVAQDPDWSLRYAAIVGLQTLASTASELCPKILVQFQQMAVAETDRAVQARVKMAIDALSNPSVAASDLQLSAPTST